MQAMMPAPAGASPQLWPTATFGAPSPVYHPAAPWTHGHAPAAPIQQQLQIQHPPFATTTSAAALSASISTAPCGPASATYFLRATLHTHHDCLGCAANLPSILRDNSSNDDSQRYTAAYSKPDSSSTAKIPTTPNSTTILLRHYNISYAGTHSTHNLLCSPTPTTFAVRPSSCPAWHTAAIRIPGNDKSASKQSPSGPTPTTFAVCPGSCPAGRTAAFRTPGNGNSASKQSPSDTQPHACKRHWSSKQSPSDTQRQPYQRRWSSKQSPSDTQPQPCKRHWSNKQSPSNTQPQPYKSHWSGSTLQLHHTATPNTRLSPKPRLHSINYCDHNPNHPHTRSHTKSHPNHSQTAPEPITHAPLPYSTIQTPPDQQVKTAQVLGARTHQTLHPTTFSTTEAPAPTQPQQISLHTQHQAPAAADHHRQGRAGPPRHGSGCSLQTSSVNNFREWHSQWTQRAQQAQDHVTPHLHHPLQKHPKPRQNNILTDSPTTHHTATAHSAAFQRFHKPLAPLHRSTSGS